jgi:outer membrane protein assembly factor BamB
MDTRHSARSVLTSLLHGVCVIAVGGVSAVLLSAATCDMAPMRPNPDPEPLPVWDAARFPWPMFGQNPRRTNQSPFNGPATYTPASPRNWRYTAQDGSVINMQATVTDAGVYFGTWGVLRRDTDLTPDMWDKSDGRYYGLHADMPPQDASRELFAPLLPAVTPVGYLYPGRRKHATDIAFTGSDNDYLVSYYNGTVEGTACVDPDDGTHYVGRGDGKVYAIDPVSGTVKWHFETFNPQLLDDPDGGGEVVGGPLLGPRGILYFATYGVPWPGNPVTNPPRETHAIYAIDRNGLFVWRYPSQEARLSNGVFVPPVISMDGTTLYVGTYPGDVNTAGELLAIDLTLPPGTPNAQRLKWSLELRDPGQSGRPNMYILHMALGIDGLLYCGGSTNQFFGAAPAVFAVRDRGNRGEFAWDDAVANPQGYPSTTGQVIGGIAIREENGGVRTVYVTTTHQRAINGDGGALFALDPATGFARATFNPGTLANPGTGSMTAPVLGADGTIYCGARGRHPGIGSAAVNGHMYAVTPTDGTLALLWDLEVDGLLDWAHPAIGANGGLYFGSSAPVNPAQQILWFEPGQLTPNASPEFYGVFD